MRCKACNNIMNNLKGKQEDDTDEDLCITCIGLSNPPDGDDKPSKVSRQEHESGFKVGWY